MERPGVQSGDEQGVPRGGKWGGDSSELAGTQTSIIREQLGVGSGEEQGAGRGGKWGRTGSAPGRKVGTIRERPGVESGGAQRLSAHSWAQRSRSGTVLTRPGTALAHTSDTPP